MKQTTISEETAERQPNDGIDLSGFNYLQLNSDSFQAYKTIEESLFLNEKYDFELWLATGVQEFEFNRATGVSEPYLAGIKLNGPTPIHTTRMEWRVAREFNSHVSISANGVKDYQNSKYLLLKKEVSNA